ncbi:hypothetical protein [Aureimonas frigidaquae]|uniref:hypothetical protein n=1 Tax=Aureimonas frigidaquae TaxID=424757 RepID=UPI000783BFBB|nr:hypothetical protein [Aureimonas frigidaquae]
MTAWRLEDVLRKHIADMDGSQPIEPAVLMLRVVLIAFLDPVFAASPDKAELADGIWFAADHVARAASPSLEPEDVRMGFGAAAGLLIQMGLRADRREPRGILLARLDRVALIADELDALFRRRRLAAHGDPFARMIAIRRAQETQPAPGAVLN